MAKRKDSQLTDKQKLFVSEYCKDFNANAAYIRAGYSKNGARCAASLLLTNINIAQAVKKHIEKVEERVVVNETMVLEGLLHEAKQLEDSTASSRVTAWTQLGKTLAMFIEKKQIAVDVTLSGFEYSE